MKEGDVVEVYEEREVGAFSREEGACWLEPALRRRATTALLLCRQDGRGGVRVRCAMGWLSVSGRDGSLVLELTKKDG